MQAKLGCRTVSHDVPANGFGTVTSHFGNHLVCYYNGHSMLKKTNSQLPILEPINVILTTTHRFAPPQKVKLCAYDFMIFKIKT